MQLTLDAFVLLPILPALIIRYKLKKKEPHGIVHGALHISQLLKVTSCFLSKPLVLSSLQLFSLQLSFGLL